jgi:hypothetical protein
MLKYAISRSLSALPWVRSHQVAVSCVESENVRAKGAGKRASYRTRTETVRDSA